MRKTTLTLMVLILLAMLAGSTVAQTRIENGTITSQNAVASYQIDVDATTITVTIQTVGTWAEMSHVISETWTAEITSYRVDVIGPGAE